MSIFSLKIDNVLMPVPPYDGFDCQLNTFWSEESGRSSVTGEWTGDLVGTKISLTCNWTNISLADAIKVRNAIYTDSSHKKAKESYAIEYKELDIIRTFTAYAGDNVAIHPVSCGLDLYNVTINLIER